MSRAPLYDALKSRADEGKLRFHMPGHKGKDVFESALGEVSRLDFTELYGTGNLYDGTYPIADAEELYAKAYNVPHAYFLTGGTTQGIYAAARLALKPGDKVLIDRGCHKSVYRALALFDAHPVYLSPELKAPYNIPDAISPEDVSRALERDEDIRWVILTCPTYYGVVCDIKAISDKIHKYGARLIVDAAHGAHFPFTHGMECPVELGADIAVTSLHKTLPALGQAAMLLTSSEFSPDEVRDATSLFGTSSPSYAVMASMDLTRRFMEDKGRERIGLLAERLSTLRENINTKTRLRALKLEAGDPLRLCVCTSELGIFGYDAAAYLENEQNVVCEMADARNVLFIITPADDVSDIETLERALMSLEVKDAGEKLGDMPKLPTPRAVYTPHQAMFLRRETVCLSDAQGRIAAESICPYPPGIPVVSAGEVIEKAHLEYLYNSGFFEDDTVKVICI